MTGPMTRSIRTTNAHTCLACTLARDTHVHTYIERLGDVVVVADVGERTTEELAGGGWVRRRLALALLEETQRRLLRLQRFLLLIFVCKKSIKTKR